MDKKGLSHDRFFRCLMGIVTLAWVGGIVSTCGCTTPGLAIQPTPAEILPQHDPDFDDLLAETLAKSCRAALAQLAEGRNILQSTIDDVDDLRTFVWEEHTERWVAFLRMNDEVQQQIRELKELRAEE